LPPAAAEPPARAPLHRILILSTEEASLEIQKLHVTYFWSHLSGISRRGRKIEVSIAEHVDVPSHGWSQT
jgi:hypothetical protein